MPALPNTLSQASERPSSLQRNNLPPVPPERSNSTSNAGFPGPPPPDNQFHSPSSSSSQPFFATPGQGAPPTRSASYGSTLSRAGSNTSEFQPQNGTYPQPPPPPPFSNNSQYIQRAPSAPGYAPGPQGPMTGPPPPRPPSEPPYPPPNTLKKSLSARSLQSQYSQQELPLPPPPLPSFPPGGPGYPANGGPGNLHAPQPRTWVPSGQLGVTGFRAVPSFHEPSPPNSPVEETPAVLGPVTSTISAEMKCKVFLKQQHAQWKALGSAKLKLYRQNPTNVKQLVVEAGSKNSVLISTIVLTDGVERVGKTGVAIELSDKGTRTGIIYMIQLRTEKSAGGLFDSLLEGSDRAAAH